MQGSVIEHKSNHTMIRPMLAEERQKLIIRAIESATVSWIAPGAWGIGLAGAGLFLKWTFRQMIAMSVTMNAAPSAVFVHKANGILDIMCLAGGTFVTIAILNVFLARKT